MQVIILAAGKSSRFFPYRNFSHKSLVSIMGKSIVEHTIESVERSGVREILMVVSENSGIKDILGDGSKYNLNIKYIIQEVPLGGGNGLILAEKLIKNDFFLLNISRVDFDQFKDSMIIKKKDDVEAVLLGRKQKDLEKYGVLKVDGDTVVDLVEKPEKGKEPSSLRLVGIYLFSKNFLKILKVYSNEHYGLEKALSVLAQNGKTKFVSIDSQTPSLKYAWDLLELKNYILSDLRKKISKKAKISKRVQIKGNVVIEDYAEVMEGVSIKGPCFIGKKSIIGNNVILRKGTNIEENCVIGANMEIKNSIVMRNTKVHSGYIGDSIIGENVRIGAGFHTANKRIDRKKIQVFSFGEEKIDTGLSSLGVVIGSNVKIGIKCSTMPGSIIGENAVVGPSTTILKNVDPDARYYTTFKETIIKK